MIRIPSTILVAIIYVFNLYLTAFGLLCIVNFHLLFSRDEVLFFFLFKKHCFHLPESWGIGLLLWPVMLFLFYFVTVAFRFSFSFLRFSISFLKVSALLLWTLVNSFSVNSLKSYYSAVDILKLSSLLVLVLLISFCSYKSLLNCSNT